MEAAAYAARLKRSEATIWRWAKAGCEFDNPESIKAFVIESERKKTNVQKARERQGANRPIAGDQSSQKPQRMQRVRILTRLNHMAMEKHQERAGAVRNMRSHVWNSRRKNRFAGCKQRYRVATGLRLMRVRPTG